MDKDYENVLNQYIEIFMYDINIKTYELRKNKYDIDNADIIFKNYYDEKMKEFKNNISKAKKLYLGRNRS
jgi:hypothetical protein